MTAKSASPTQATPSAYTVNSDKINDPKHTAQRTRVIVWGLGTIGLAFVQSAADNDALTIVGAFSDIADHEGRKLGDIAGALNTTIKSSPATRATAEVKVTSDVGTLLDLEADCVVITPSPATASSEIDAWILALLAAGKNVISTVAHAELLSIHDLLSIHELSAQTELPAHSELLQACQTGKASFHVTGLFPHLLVERFALTLGRAMQRVEHVRVIQAIDCSAATPALWGELTGLGFGRVFEQSEEHALSPAWQQHLRGHQSAMLNVARQLQEISTPRTTTHWSMAPAKNSFTVHGESIPQGSAAAISLIQHSWQNEHCFLTLEQHWYLGKDYATTGEGIPYGHFNTPYSFTVQVEGDPSRIDAQLELEPVVAGINPLVHATVQGILAAIIPVCSAAPGIVWNDAAPRYQSDDRLPATHTSNFIPKKSRKTPGRSQRKRVVIWGPGEIGGAVVRAALQRSDVEIVGAKVFSPHKHGKDLGQLVGIGPIGIRATRSKKEIFALKPDCVIITPQPRAITEGLDNDVLELLEAGINVITSAAYHNVSMPNWLASAQTPTALLQEVAQTTGMAKNRAEEIAFAANKRLMPLTQRGILKQIIPPIIDRLLTPAVRRAMPFRATPQGLQNACIKGNASLHGTGVHPTFMAERVGLQLARLLDEPHHMRFVEAADFSYMPDGMWGGLSGLGFGKPVSDLDASYLIARAGDFYYGDVTGNIAHLLFGVPSTHVRVERSFRALPATHDFKVGSLLIRKGSAAALHMQHKGYIGSHHFFTNEECWYLGPECEYRGEHLPFGEFKTPISYTVEVTGKPAKLAMQLSMDSTGKAAAMYAAADIATADMRCALGQQFKQAGITNPITQATAMAILDAVTPVCDMDAGVIIDDVRPDFRVKGTGS